ncbi:MAG: hypothetical protein KGM96_08375 [Acidobacteriota bacterium]|nr:hypothetical protein [Acidobacteriota bacterium]
MRIHRSVFALLAAVLVLAVFAWAQPPRAGLYETTSNMTWQVSTFPNGMAPLQGPNTQPFEWTVESTSVYKGADCGNVKP